MTRLLGVKPFVGAAAVVAVVSAWTTHALVFETSTAQVSTDLGKVHLRVSGSGVSADLDEMSVAHMIPGQATAGVLTVQNTGTAPTRYSLGALFSHGTTDQRAFATALLIRVTHDDHTAASGRSTTCPGKTVPGSAPHLAPNMFGASRRLAPGDSETLCIEARLPQTAPSSLQGMSSNIRFEVTGAS